MIMKKYIDGDHIYLNFEDYNNEEYFRGWVDLYTCKESIKLSFGDDCEVLGVIRHTYAFYGIGYDEMGDMISVLYESDHSGRGKFKVTVCDTKRTY